MYRTPANWQGFSRSIRPGLRAANPATLAAITHNAALDIDAAALTHAGPALMILGRQDNMVGYRDPLTIIDNYPRMTVALLAGAGHTVMLDQPAAVARPITPWLA